MSLAELQALEARAVLPTYARLPVEFVRGEGCSLWDDAGTEYLDLMSGLSVSNVGHCHPAVVAAIREQAGRLLHVTNLFYVEGPMRLAARLSDASLGGKVFFCNSGAEANEAAIKLARKRRRGGDLVVVRGGFHGRTYGALSATPQESKQAPFAPLVPGFVDVPAEAAALRAAVGEGTAAVLLEVVQGESGVWPLGEDVLAAAREACDATGAALIFDEVQTGLGRTGTMWAYEQSGVVPDAITVAKSLAGGLPMGALITTPQLADVLEPGDHGSTFAGAPVAAAAAHAVLDVIGADGFLEAVQEKGALLRAGLESLPGVRSVRGIGLMVACEIDGDAPALVRRGLAEQRVVLNATGPTTLRFLPPLVISEAQLEDALHRVQALLG